MEVPARPRPSPMPTTPKPPSAEPEKKVFVKPALKRIERKLMSEQIEPKVYRYLKHTAGSSNTPMPKLFC